MRLYSEEWVAAFNEAVEGPVTEGPATEGPATEGPATEGPATEGPAFRMLQIVGGGPEGTVRVALCAGTGRLSMEREPGDDPAPDVTVSMQFDDAIALARGGLDPAALLAAGRVKVRGDLSVLVRGQSLLAEAVRRLEPLSDRTTT
ncbi:MAG: SCP2 sterol-binding domain-containing protein [Acidimicrobiales bacterium]